jgi:hypothetical protein
MVPGRNGEPGHAGQEEGLRVGSKDVAMALGTGAREEVGGFMYYAKWHNSKPVQRAPASEHWTHSESFVPGSIQQDQPRVPEPFETRAICA